MGNAYLKDAKIKNYFLIVTKTLVQENNKSQLRLLGQDLGKTPRKKSTKLENVFNNFY